MKTQDDLFELIKSLTKAEKSYLSKFAKGFSKKENPAHFELIEILDGMKEYDEKLFAKKTQHIKNLSYLKNYTYHFVIENLVKANAGQSKYYELNAQAVACNILFDKGLYGQCEKNIKKIRKEASEHGYYDILLKVDTIQERISREELHLDKILENLEQNKSKELFDKISTVGEIKQLYAELSTYTLKNPDQLDERVKSAKSKAILLIDQHKNETDIEIQRWIMQLDVMLNVLNRSFKSFSKIKKTLKLYESNQVLLKENFHEYMMLNTLYFFIFCKTNHHGAALSHINHLKEVIHNDSLGLTDQVRQKFLQRTNNFLINHCIENGHWKIIDDQIDTVFKEFDLYERSLGSLDFMWFCHFASYYFFTVEQFSKAHHWIYKMINSDFYPDRKMSHTVTRIYLLFLQYELKNHDYLLSALRNEKRYVDKLGIGDEMEAVIIQSLEKALNGENEKAHLKKLKEVLSEKSFKKNLTANILDFFNVYAWLDSKIKDKPFRSCFESNTLLQPVLKYFMNPELNVGKIEIVSEAQPNNT